MAPVVFINSNCNDLNSRDRYVSELMKYIKVDAYGRCLHNKDFPGGDQGGKSKIETIGKYKFVLAFENSSEKDYVSEKIFHVLHVGSVPVYMGAPNIDDFLPDPLAAIKTADYRSGFQSPPWCFDSFSCSFWFRSPKELAMYLQFLIDNPGALGMGAQTQACQ